MSKSYESYAEYFWSNYDDYYYVPPYYLCPPQIPPPNHFESGDSGDMASSENPTSTETEQKDQKDSTEGGTDDVEEEVLIDEVLSNDDNAMVVDEEQTMEEHDDSELQYEMDETEEFDENEHDEQGEEEEEDQEEVAVNVEATDQQDNMDDEENEGDALNISVEESEKIGIDEDGKIPSAGEDDQTKKCEEDEDNQVESDVLEKSNSSPASKKEADQDNKANEGESEEVTTKSKEHERHIILVTGLSSETSANDLKTLFRKYGKIGRIKIMTNTRVPGSQRFAHISVVSLDDLSFLVDTLNGAELKGKCIRVSKAPDDGSISRSYEIAVAAAKEEEEGVSNSERNDADKDEQKTSESEQNTESGKPGSKDESEGTTAKGTDGDGDDIQVIQETGGQKDAEGKAQESDKKSPSPEKKKEAKKEQKESPNDKKKSPEKTRPDKTAPPPGHRPRREPHDRPRGGANFVRNQRNFRREKVEGEWKRHGPASRMEVTRVHRDRVPDNINRMYPGGGRGGGYHQPNAGGRRRSPNAPTLTFEQIREIRDEQRRREIERRKREEERERAAEVERQKRLEYQNYMEFKQLEKEREKLRMERERIEREKLELIKMERERQKAEREKIEREKEELRRAKMNIEHHSHRSGPLKRPYEEIKDRRRDSVERNKKPYGMERGRPDGKTEAERKLERDRYERDHLHGSPGVSDIRATRSPIRDAGARESRRDIWTRDERVKDRNRGDVGHRRESEALKSTDRRAREAPSRASAGSSDLMPRYPIDNAHSAGRSTSSSKRPGERYEDTRASGRDDQWVQRSYLAPSSSLSLPMGSSAGTSRENWPLGERKLEAWDTSRLPARSDQWISGAGTTLGASGRSSLPVIAPPPPIYSNPAGLGLPASGIGLGSYSSERYDNYKGFHHLRRF